MKFVVTALCLFLFCTACASAKTTDCEKIENRVFSASGSWTVLGDKWLWSDSNLAFNRQDPSFRSEIVEMFKKEKQWDSIKNGFDKPFSQNEPIFMANLFVALSGIKLAKASFSYRNGKWLFIDKKYICKTSPTVCFAISKTTQPLLSSERKDALSAFLNVVKSNKIEDFCSDIKADKDKVYSKYSERTKGCSKPKWASLSDYCSSIAMLTSEISAQVNH